jgi:CRP-like cAMP-binding protein
MSTTDTLPITEALRGVPLFQGMTDGAIDAIATLAQPTTFAAGETLVQEGEPGESFLIITEGRATVEQGGQQIRELGGGDFLGEISLIDGGPRTATVTAIEPIEALRIERDGFGRLMNEFPAVRYGLVSALTVRLREHAPAVSD